MNKEIKRFTVVGRTKSTKYQPTERGVDLGDRSEVDYAATATLVPIEDEPSKQIKLLETDDEQEAHTYIRNYNGDLIGLHVIDAEVNGRPGYRR